MGKGEIGKMFYGGRQISRK